MKRKVFLSVIMACILFTLAGGNIFERKIFEDISFSSDSDKTDDNNEVTHDEAEEMVHQPLLVSPSPMLNADESTLLFDSDVPQNGTWQLKCTTDKKYIILGTDDDNVGNAKFFRLLRSYNFPYTMNTEAENVSS